MARNVVQVGANVVCRINGQVFGSVTGLMYRLLSPRMEERGIDSIQGFELAPVASSVVGSVQMIMVRDSENLEATGATAGLPDVLGEKYFELHIEDASDGFSILKAEQVSVEEQMWTMTAKNVVSGQFTFKGLVAKPHFNQ